MELVIILIGIVAFFVGFGLVFGSSWALFLVDLLFQSPGGGWVKREKKTYKGSKNTQVRFIGVLLILVGVIAFFYGILNL